MLLPIGTNSFALQALQLFFVFSPAYPWPQGLVMRVLLLAVPMAIWMVLLPLTWSAFRAVTELLGQPWLQEQAPGQGQCMMWSAAGELVQPPEALLPLMRGAWLVSGTAHRGRVTAVCTPSSQSSSQEHDT